MAHSGSRGLSSRWAAKETMRNTLCLIALLAGGLMTARTAAQSPLPLSSLCELQMKAAQGEHKRVRVEGVFLAGGPVINREGLR